MVRDRLHLGQYGISLTNGELDVGERLKKWEILANEVDVLA
jgi:hypothetical protein